MWSVWSSDEGCEYLRESHALTRLLFLTQEMSAKDCKCSSIFGKMSHEQGSEGMSSKGRNCSICQRHRSLVNKEEVARFLEFKKGSSFSVYLDCGQIKDLYL